MAYRPPARDPLTWLVAGATTLMWIAAGIDAIVTGQFRVFEIATGPYLGVVGFITGIKVIRGGNGNGREKP